MIVCNINNIITFFIRSKHSKTVRPFKTMKNLFTFRKWKTRGKTQMFVFMSI